MPSRYADLFLLAVLGSLAPAYVFSTAITHAETRRVLLLNVAASVCALAATVRLIPVVKKYTLKRGMFGLDINKRGTPAGDVQIPESMGLVTAMTFVVFTILFQFFQYSENGVNYKTMNQYNAALFSITFQVFLGFIDDVLDIPWRVKLILPTIAALPLLMAYAGHTSISVPRPLRAAIGLEFLELGILYKVYMVLLSVFCTNSINIFAGINGLEAGQTMVMAMAVLTHNLVQIGALDPAAAADADVYSAHVFSACVMMPLAGTTLGLLVYNWYPSEVFVGDTFTYFAGMVFAVAGIMGHFSETLLLFFLPQIINFLYSIPQLLKIVPCPRHRLPKFDKETGLLHPTPNMNLVNLALRVLGPQTERVLCIKLLAFQALCCALCFGARWVLAGWWKA